MIEPMPAASVMTSASSTMINCSLAKVPVVVSLGADFTVASTLDVVRPAGMHEVQRQRDGQVHDRVDQAGASPAESVRQESAQRPADGARKSAEQRQIGDRSARLHVRTAGRARRMPRRRGRSPSRRQHDPSQKIERQRGREPDARRGLRQRTPSLRRARVGRRGGRPGGRPAGKSAPRPAIRSTRRRPPRPATSRCRRRSVRRAPRENRRSCPIPGSGRRPMR